MGSQVLRQPSRKIQTEESRLAIRGLINAAENVLEEHKTEPVQHVNHFADGLYARELTMPAGLILTSKIHKTNHFAFILKGKAEVIDENSGAELIEAPCMIKTLAGTKRILRILEECTWVTVHATEETDVDIIEEQIISKNHLNTLEVQS